MRTIEARENAINNLGKQYEHNATAVTFNLSSYFTEHPEGVFTLHYQRPEDTEPYEVDQFSMGEGGVGVWLVSEKDTEQTGYGYAEIVIEDNEYRKKTVTYKTIVLKSITRQKS